MEEVASSILASSTLRGALRTPSPAAHFLGGFVAGEGYFGVSRRRERFLDGSYRLRFTFSVQVAARDRALLMRLADGFGCGAIYDRTPGKPRHRPTSAFEVHREADHLGATIPFAEVYLPPSAKRVQFERWRDTLLTYRQDRPSRHGRGTSSCSVDGCDEPVRGRGLCRRHYYGATGY